MTVQASVATLDFYCPIGYAVPSLRSTNICNPIIDYYGPFGSATLPKCNRHLGASFEITIQGSVGNCERLCVIDPFFTTLAINTGHSVTQTFDDVKKAEHYINITNGNPGLKVLSLRVNGQAFKKIRFNGWRPGQVINVDAGSVMTQDTNTLSFIGQGEVGTLANIFVGDTAPATKTSPASHVAASTQVKTQDAGIWGPLVDSTEDNTADQQAIAATQQIHLEIAAVLDPRSASEAPLYAVSVKGSPAAAGVQVSASPSPNETTLVLTLPPKSFAAGDAIEVRWTGLKTAKGQPLSGHVELIAE